MAVGESVAVLKAGEGATKEPAGGSVLCNLDIVTQCHLVARWWIMDKPVDRAEDL